MKPSCFRFARRLLACGSPSAGRADGRFARRLLAWGSPPAGRAMVLLVSLGVAACARPGGDTAGTSGGAGAAGDLAALEARLAAMDERLGKIETALEPLLNRPPEPDPKVVYAVPVEGDPFIGPADAKVTVVEAFEFACPYCAKAAPTMKELLAAYPGDVKVVHKQYIVHPEHAVTPALASCAARAQGKYAEMVELIWAKAFQDKDLGRDRMMALAAELGLDAQRFEADMKAAACQEWLSGNMELLGKLGVSGTPTFYINGRYLVGAQPLAAFKELVDEELAKANAAIAAGTPQASYYQKAVVEAGVPSLQ